SVGLDTWVTPVGDVSQGWLALAGSPALASRDVREQEKAKFSRSMAQAAAIASSELPWRSEPLHARSSFPLAFSRLHTSARNLPSPTRWATGEDLKILASFCAN